MVIAKWISGAGLALLAATAAGAAAPGFPAHATGDWVGTVQTKDKPTHLFVHIHWRLAGDYVATLYSPEREIGEVVVRPVAAPDGVLAFSADGGQFQGRWSEANGRWEGTWTEAGASAPLTLSLNDDSTALRIGRLQSLRNTTVTGPGVAAAPPDIVPPEAR